MKYNDAYLRQITLYPRYQMNEQSDQFRDRHFLTNSPYRVVLYLTVISLQYFANLVWPCLFTINKNFIICIFVNYYKLHLTLILIYLFIIILFSYSYSKTKSPILFCFLFIFDIEIFPHFNLVNINFVKQVLQMKFLVSDNQGRKELQRSLQAMQQETDNIAQVYYNINHPTNKIQCDVCKKDISKHTKILTSHNDYCVGCFSNLDELPQCYYVINKLDFPLFDVDWSADQELLLFQGLQKHGFGNWSEIAQFMGTGKTREEVQHHYTTVYLQSPNFIPDNRQILSKRDAETKRLNKQSTNRIFKRKTRQQPTNSKNQRGYLTVNSQANGPAKTGANPAQIIGYMPKRGDFQVQYDNQAQLLLAEMEFNDDDTEQQKQMKFNLINIYNHKLTERIRRKQFVITRNLLDFKEQARIEKNRSKEEKQIYNIMRVFARFSSAEDHQQLVQGIIRQKQIRQRIQQLKEFKKKGFKTLAEVEEELENKRKKDEKIRRKGQQLGQVYNYDPNKTRRNTKTPGIDRTQKRSSYMSRQQDELCKKLNLSNRNYISIKQKIIRQCIKQGILEKDSVSKLFKVDRKTIDSIFDFLVVKQEIISK